MRRKLLVGTILPILTAGAIIGSRFSLWIFDTTGTNNQQAVKKELAQFTQVGEISLGSKITFNFDQSQKYRQDHNIESDKDAKGIYLTYEKLSEDSEVAASKEVKYDTYSGSKETSYQLTTQLTISNDLAQYIVVSYNGDTVTPEDKGTSKVYNMDAVINSSFSWENVTFDYANTKEPSNITEYQALQAILTSAEISVLYTVTLTA